MGQQRRTELLHVPLIDVGEERGGRFGQRLHHVTSLLKHGVGPVHIDQRELAGKQEGADALAERLHLLRRHHPVGQPVEQHRHAVVVRRMRGNALHLRSLASAEVVHDTREVPVTPEGDHEGNLVADRGPPGRHNGQAAREADADHADVPVRRERRLCRHPRDGVFEHIGGARGDPVALQVRQRQCHGADARAGQVVGESLEARLVDAHGVDAGHEHDRARHATRRLVEARRDVTVARRHHVRGFDGHRVGARIRDRLDASTDLRGADDERECARVRRGGVGHHQYRDQRREPGDAAARCHASRMLHSPFTK